MNNLAFLFPASSVIFKHQHPIYVFFISCVTTPIFRKKEDVKL